MENYSQTSQKEQLYHFYEIQTQNMISLVVSFIQGFSWVKSNDSYTGLF